MIYESISLHKIQFQMKIRQIAEILDARVLCGSDKMDYSIEVAFASDLMSDVLTLKNDHVLLITGLANTQTIRTAEMSDIQCVVFARNKIVTEDMLELARQNEIVVLQCRYSLFRTCGLLYGAGVKPVF
jgi:predicted transcriptional regulator